MNQTLRSVKTDSLPGGGWLSSLSGVRVTDCTPPALSGQRKRSGHHGREYRLFPVFLYDDQGQVTQLLHAALTNTPALDGMNEVLIAASRHFARSPPHRRNTPWMMNSSVSCSVIYAGCSTSATATLRISSGTAESD
ncbi:hypothetical protein CRX48_00855 [Morganella morganii]|nr:hypothetical protein CRX48_00855 [Morganella morganii]